MQKYSFFNKVSTYSHSFGRFNGFEMEVFAESSVIQDYLQKQREKGKSIGFVATMGSLHSGHLALVKQAKNDNDLVITSIFVNPTQFNNAEDLEKYPRNEERDLKNLQSVDCDIVFLPAVKELYPDEVKGENINLRGLDRLMEGTFRPNHFQGVATVIRRFFDILNPDKAYFGLKDYQQYLIVKNVANDLGFKTEVIGSPIERNNKGLALSSRNERLSEDQKEEALIIYECLNWAQRHHKDHSPKEIKERTIKRFRESSLELEYVEICEAELLKPLENWNGQNSARMFIAAFAGKVRLIDNEMLF